MLFKAGHPPLIVAFIGCVGERPKRLLSSRAVIWGLVVLFVIFVATHFNPLICQVFGASHTIDAYLQITDDVERVTHGKSL
jgi:hypothetical protein